MRPHLRSFVAAALVTAAAVVPSVVSASPTGGALPPVLINVHPVAGEYGIPDDATMVAATVTAIRPADRGWIKVYPCDQDEPTTANLNYEAEQVINNLVLSRIADDGTICVATFAIADYVIDLAGYVPAGSDITPLDTPIRALNTKKDGGPSPVPANNTTTLQLAGDTLPDTAQLAIFNLTAVSTDAYGYITAYPCNETPATTSNVNYAPGRAVANLVITRLAPNGTVCFRNNNPVDIIVDVAGHATNGIVTLPTPERILNTRNTPGPVPADSTTTIDPDLPAGATAAIYNLTIAEAQAPGHATAYPCNQPLPKASNVNHPATVAAGAASITKLDPTGRFCIHNLSAAELIIDLTGYTTGTTHYTPITPTRLHDTRQGWQRTCDWFVMADSLDGLLVVNIRTGATRALPLPPEHRYFPGQSRHPVINSTCDGVLHYGNNTLFRIGFDGSVVATPVPFVLDPLDVPGLNPEGTVRPLSDGTVVHVHERVVDLETAEDRGPGAPSVLRVGGLDFGQDYYRTDISIAGNGSIIAAAYASGSQTRAFVQVLRRDGSQLARFDLEANPVRLDISPDGKYIVVNTFWDVDIAGVSWVYTAFGDLVDLAYGYELTPVAAFTGAGELVACVGAVGMVTWDLFGGLDIAIPLTGPLFTQHHPYCPTLGT